MNPYKTLISIIIGLVLGSFPLRAQVKQRSPGTNFAGSGAPGSLTFSRYGDIYVDTATSATYICTDPASYCSGVATGEWVLSGTGGGGSGTVTSVALSAPSIFSVGGSPVTSSGTLALSLANQTANTGFFGPTTGSAAAPTFRAIVKADLPSSVVHNDQANTYSSGFLQDLSAAYLKLPTVAIGSLPAASSASGRFYLVTGVAASTACSGSGSAVALCYSDGSSWIAMDTGGGGGGSGTVTSVALSLPAIFSVSGSPVTTSGTLTATLASQTANTLFSGPTSGGSTTPTFRAMVKADTPATTVHTDQANTYSSAVLQDLSSAKFKPPTSVIASLPTASSNTNALYMVTDGTGRTDCTSGGGSYRNLCVSDGSTWIPFATSTAFYSNTFTSQTSITVSAATHGYGTDPVLVAVYDGSNDLVDAGINWNSSTGAVVMTFATSTSGRYVIAGSGGSGGGGGGMTNPMTTLGDIIYGAASGTPTRLAGNTTSSLYILSQTGTGSVSAAPAWIGTGTGVATWLATPSSANLAAAVTDETGSGALVFATSPTLTTPNLGTPSAATLTNATGLPISTGVSGLGTGVATFLGTPSSANLAAAITDETGSGSLVFATSPALTTPNLGTPSAATLTNATGLPLSTGVTGTLPIGNGGTGQTTANAALNALLPSQTSNSGKYLASDGTNTAWTNEIRLITFTFDGGGSTVVAATSTGSYVNTACTINQAVIEGDQSGSASVTISKAAYGTTPSYSSISSGFALSSAVATKDTTLSGWTTTVAADSFIRAAVTGTPSGVQKLTVTLRCI